MSEISWEVDQQEQVEYAVGSLPETQWGSTEYVEVYEKPAPRYEGSYQATPTSETQVFETQGLNMVENFTVDPIPSNYGLITWDGTIITVS